jgi:DNA topoisomerase VI subunit B
MLRPVAQAVADRAVREIGGKPARKTKLARKLKVIGRFLKPATEMLRPVGEALARRAVKEIGGAKKTSPWIVHVKQYCAEHGCSYKEGLKLASPSYRN